MTATRILVAQVLDEGNYNAQVSNAVNLIAHSPDESTSWLVPYYERPANRLKTSPQIRWTRLIHGRLWRLHKSWFYQTPADLLFYPGPYWFDGLGLRLRDWTGRSIPIVATLEGLPGDDRRERQLSEWAGHPVYCQRVSPTVRRTVDDVYLRADHIVAISPFIAKMGRRLYGDKFSVLPLGLDAGVFHPDSAAAPSPRPRVIGAGRLYANKRPEVFVRLAQRFPEADFIWYGEGELRDRLQSQITSESLTNLCFPGPLDPRRLAEEMRRAWAFVLPSLSEGVPKVTQEAAACGLPVVVFGYYETPTVRTDENGFVVWNDAELVRRLGDLLTDNNLRTRLSKGSLKMAKEWDWTDVVPRWQGLLSAAANGNGLDHRSPDRYGNRAKASEIARADTPCLAPITKTGQSESK